MAAAIAAAAAADFVDRDGDWDVDGDWSIFGFALNFACAILDSESVFGLVPFFDAFLILCFASF